MADEIMGSNVQNMELCYDNVEVPNTLELLNDELMNNDSEKYNTLQNETFGTAKFHSTNDIANVIKKPCKRPCKYDLRRQEIQTCHSEANLNNDDLIEQRFDCNICEKEFPKERYLKDHVRRIHSSDESQKCELCGKEIKKYLWDQHLYRVHSKGEFKCGTCNKSFPNEKYLKDHIRRMHSDKNLIKCELCGKEIRKQSLNEHLIRDHSSGKMFKCENCGKEFPKEKYLKDHVRRIHSSDTSQKCELCGKEVKKYLWDQHLYRVHSTGVFKCETCDNSFPNEKYLKDHVRRVHSDKNLIKCDLCGKEIRKQSLNEHLIRDHSSGEIFKCENCEKEFSNEKYLKDHVRRIHSSDTSQKCELCGKEVKKYLWNQHLYLVHSKGDFKCETCSKSFPNEKYLKDHIRRMHSDKNLIKSDLCGKEIRKQSLNELLIRDHSSGKMFKCENCGKEFLKEKYLKDHVRRIHSSNTSQKCELCGKEVKKYLWDQHLYRAHSEGNFDCETCSKSFANEKYLKDHIGRVHCVKILVKCELCGKEIRKRSLNEHLKCVHSKEKKFKCETCEKGFSSKKYLSDHVRKVHHSTRSIRILCCNLCGQSYEKGSLREHFHSFHPHENPHRCETCGKEFLLKKYLESHKTRIHRLGKPHKCEICGKAFSKKGFLATHVRRVHAEKHIKFNLCQQELKSSINKEHLCQKHSRKPLRICEICNKEFKLKLEFTRHLRMHKNQSKKYKCVICGNAFDNKVNFDKHNRLHNKGTKPFKCNHCPKVFSLALSLENHKSVHTGKYPFKCGICGSGFHWKYLLKRHVRTHTGESASLCNVCGKELSSDRSLKIHHDRKHAEEKPCKCKTCGKDFSKYCFKTHVCPLTGISIPAAAISI